MSFPAGLGAYLHVLTAVAGLDEDLEGLLRAVVRDLKAAIPTALGLSLTMRIDSRDISLTTVDDQNVEPVRASLLFPLGSVTRPDAMSCMVFYASAPGAFVDLAADIGWALDLPGRSILVDQHLLAPFSGSTLTGVRELSAINQAVGVLITQGHTQASARRELDRRADRTNATVVFIAIQILRSITVRRAMNE